VPPSPPAHWVERVRESAPELLDPTVRAPLEFRVEDLRASGAPFAEPEPDATAAARLASPDEPAPEMAPLPRAEPVAAPRTRPGRPAAAEPVVTRPQAGVVVTVRRTARVWQPESVPAPRSQSRPPSAVRLVRSVPVPGEPVRQPRSRSQPAPAVNEPRSRPVPPAAMIEPLTRPRPLELAAAPRSHPAPAPATPPARPRLEPPAVAVPSPRTGPADAVAVRAPRTPALPPALRGRVGEGGPNRKQPIVRDPFAHGVFDSGPLSAFGTSPAGGEDPEGHARPWPELPRSDADDSMYNVEHLFASWRRERRLIAEQRG
jgi:hypothetical protein